MGTGPDPLRPAEGRPDGETITATLAGDGTARITTRHGSRTTTSRALEPAEVAALVASLTPVAAAAPSPAGEAEPDAAVLLAEVRKIVAEPVKRGQEHDVFRCTRKFNRIRALLDADREGPTT